MAEADHQKLLQMRQGSLDRQPPSCHSQPRARGFSIRPGEPIELCDGIAQVAASKRDLGGSYSRFRLALRRTFDPADRDQRTQPAYFEDGAPLGDEDEDAYDDPPRSGRRGGLLTAVTLIGCAMIGTAGAYGVSQALTSLLHGVSPTDPLTFAGTLPLMAVTAALASFIPARRALRLDPIKALRQE